MPEAYDKHIRITAKQHRLYDHFNSIPASSVSGEMLLLMELGLMFQKNNQVVADLSSLSSAPIELKSAESTNTEKKLRESVVLDDFDISDAMFDSVNS